ncbi:MAG: TonB-dependent receptor [Steroidobacteraceae bacterium]
MKARFNNSDSPSDGVIDRLPVVAAVACAVTALFPAATTRAAEDAQGIALDEVIVTAQKRDENVRDVPSSLSVISGDNLKTRQIVSIDDLARSVPNLSITTQGKSGQGQYAVRGVSSPGTPGTIGQPTVGMYIDDVSISTPTGGSRSGFTAPNIFDVARVEVLRGPQGTLYGSGAMGGTIRFISNEPDLHSFRTSLLASLSNTDGSSGLSYVTQGVVNVPLIEGSLGLRIGARVSEEQGYIDTTNLITGKVSENVQKTQVVRASLKYESTDGSLTVLPAVFAQRDRPDGSFNHSPAAGNTAETRVDLVTRDEVFVPSLTIKKSFSLGTLTSATSYFYRDSVNVTDRSVQTAAPALGFIWVTPYYLTADVTQVAEELRFASKSMEESGLPISWLVGAYGSRHRTVGDARMVFSDYTNFVPAVNNAYAANPDRAAYILTFGDDMYTQISSATITQYAAFGEFSWRPIGPLTLTAGLRYMTATNSADNFSSGLYQGFTASYAEKLKSNATTPKLAAHYAISDTVSVYANAINGFRLGGVGQPVPTNPNSVIGATCIQALAQNGLTKSPTTYAADSLWNYELGTKGIYFDNRLSVDVAVYYIRWSDVQQPIGLGNCQYGYVINAGLAESKGVDAEIRARLTRQLELSLAGSITRATITNAVRGSGTADGDWLLGVPRYQFNAGGSFSQPFQSFVVDANVNGRWVGPSRGGFVPTRVGYNQSGYFLLDASAGLNFGTFRVAIQGKNLLNSNTVLSQASAAPQYVYSLQPRTVGLQMEANF